MRLIQSRCELLPSLHKKSEDIWTQSYTVTYKLAKSGDNPLWLCHYGNWLFDCYGHKETLISGALSFHMFLKCSIAMELQMLKDAFCLATWGQCACEHNFDNFSKQLPIYTSSTHSNTSIHLKLCL